MNYPSIFFIISVSTGCHDLRALFHLIGKYLQLSAELELCCRLRLYFLMHGKAATCHIPTMVPIPHKVFLQASHSLLFSTTIALGGFFLLPLPSRCLYLIACSKHSFLTWLFSEVIMRFPPPISLDLRVRQLLPAI